jgi:hypothetical protein
VNQGPGALVAEPRVACPTRKVAHNASHATIPAQADH